MWIFSEDACLDHRPLHWTQGRLPTRGLLRAPRPTPHRERQVRPHQEPQDPRHPYRGYVVSIKPIIVFQIITFPFLFSCSSKENYTLEQPSVLIICSAYMLPASILRKSSAATIMKFELLTVRITSSIQNSELPTCARFPSTNVNIFRRCMFRPPSSALNAGTPSNPRTASSPSANSSSWTTSSSSPRTSRPSPSLQRLRGQHQAYHCISNNNVSIFIFM